jgi:hypothetical protein
VIRQAVIGNAPNVRAAPGVAYFPLPISTRAGLGGAVLRRVRRSVAWLLVPRALLLAEAVELIAPPKIVRLRVARVRREAGLRPAEVRSGLRELYAE